MTATKYLGLRGKALNHALLGLIICPAFTLFGYNQGAAGGLLNLPSWVATFPSIDTVNTTGSQKVENARIQGTVVAVYTAAGLFGALSCIWLGDWLGRRVTIFIGAAFALVGAVLQGSSFSLGQFVVGRVIAGLGVGGITATAPNWQSECSTAAHRGAVVLMEGFFAILGLVIQGWTELGMSFVKGDASWRFNLLLPILFAGAIMVAMPFVPESPRWLVLRGRSEEAKHVLTALEDADEDSAKIQQDLEDIQKSIEIAGKLGFRDAFKIDDRRLFHRLCICCAVQFFQQICGINCLVYYQTTIFLQIGVSNIDARILSASVFTWGLLTMPIGVWGIDRFGRRPLFLTSAIGMGICMAVAAGTTSQPDSKVALGFACLAVFLYNPFFGIGFLGSSFLYAAEIAPLSLRVPITALSTATVWSINFMTVEVTPVGLSTLGYQFYIVWAAMNLCLVLPGVYFFFPETKGLSLEAIDKIFMDSRSSLQTVAVAAKMHKAGPSGIRLGEDVENVKDAEDVYHAEEKTG